MQSPLKRIGGKSQAVDRIIDAFPMASAYDRFVDVCGGAGWILLGKSPYQHEEIYNDLDNNLYAFWKTMQTQATELQRRLDEMLYFRAQYYEYYRSLFDGTELSQMERAMRFFYCLRGTGTGWLRRSPVGWNYGGVQSYRTVLELFEQIQSRLRYVAIDNRNALATIKRYAGTRTLFYIDPPYFGAEQYYEASKKGFPHAEMAALLQEVEGYVAISYYPCPEIDTLYPASKWNRITWMQHKSSQIQIPDRVDMATEQLITNYDLVTRGLWTTVA